MGMLFSKILSLLTALRSSINLHGRSFGWALNSEIQLAAGSLQASTGLKGGAETTIHVMKDVYNETETDGVILVDASNAFKP